VVFFPGGLLSGVGIFSGLLSGGLLSGGLLSGIRHHVGVLQCELATRCSPTPQFSREHKWLAGKWAVGEHAGGQVIVPFSLLITVYSWTSVPATDSCLPWRNGPSWKVLVSGLTWCRKLSFCLQRSWRPGSAVFSTTHYTAVWLTDSIMGRQCMSQDASSVCPPYILELSKRLFSAAGFMCMNQIRVT